MRDEMGVVTTYLPIISPRSIKKGERETAIPPRSWKVIRGRKAQQGGDGREGL